MRLDPTEGASPGEVPLDVFVMLFHNWVGRKTTEFLNVLRMTRLADSYPLRFHWCPSTLVALQGNLIYLSKSILSRLPLVRPLTYTPLVRGLPAPVYLPTVHLKRVGAHVVHSLHYFPANRIGVPVLLEHDFFAYGPPGVREVMARIVGVPRWMVARSAVVSVRHELSLQAFREQFPEYADRGMVIPHYLPDLEAVDEEKVKEKFRNFGRRMRLLFVGNLARLKGLPELLQAYRMATQEEGVEIEFTVVTRFQDGPVPLPPEVTHLSNLPATRVYQLMEEAHVVALPSKREATGNVYWEGMAKGCALIFPNYDPQRTLFADFGRAVDPLSPQQMAEALVYMARNPDFTLECALRARRVFLQKYHHSVVGRLQYEAFLKAVERGPAE